MNITDKPKYKYNFQSIPLDKLNTTKYQRPLDEKRIREMAKDFDPDIVGVLLVSERDGEFYLLDGMHRRSLLLSIGEVEAMCQVMRGLTYEDEARKFNQLNTKRKSLSSQDLFIAGIEAKNDIDIIIYKIINDCDIKFQRGINNKSDHITCISTCKEVYRKRGGDNLYQTLGIIFRTWDGKNKSLSARMVKGVSEFIFMYGGKFAEYSFINKLSDYEPEELLLEAQWSVGKNGTCKSMRHGTLMANILYDKYSGVPNKIKSIEPVKENNVASFEVLKAASDNK